MPSIIRVGPTEKKPTHHISLTDGESTVGLIMCTSDLAANPLAISRAAVPRTAMKTTTGNQKYSDFEPPWSPIAQDNWSGGRGMLEFERDVTRYNDSYLANTVHEYVFNGGLPTYARGLRSAQRHNPGDVSWRAMLSGSNNYLATRVVFTSNFTAKSLQVLVQRVGNPSDMTIGVYTNSGGYPDTEVWSDTVSIADVDDWPSRWLTFSIDLPFLSGDVYWLVFHGAGDQDNHWLVGKEDTGSTMQCLEGPDGNTWSDSEVYAYFDFLDALTNKPVIFFSYRNQQYVIVNPLDNSAPKIYENGDRGLCTSSTASVMTVSSKTWVTNQWQNWYVVIVGGKGLTQRRAWRKIVSNTLTGITVDTAWDIVPDNTTEFIICGGDEFFELTGHGLTVPVNNVIVVNNVIYFALGDSTNIRRARYDAGAWTWADDGSNKAYLLRLVNESSGPQVWRANNSDANNKISVSNSGVKDWGTNLSFGTAIVFNDDKGSINSLEEYGDTYRYLWVLRDGSLFSIEKDSNNVAYAALEMPLREMSALSRDTNGAAHLVHNVYMYFNLGPGIERYYQRTLDDVGPNRDNGLPPERQGYCSAMAGYPGKYYAAYNAGDAGYSSILCFNGVGWSEVYRARATGHYIDAISFQPAVGDQLARLWIHCGDDLLYLPFPVTSLDPTNDPGYRYTHESYVVTGWMSAGMVDIYKLLHSVKIFTDGLVEGKQWVEVDYQLDQDTAWRRMPEPFYTSPVSEVAFPGSGETAKRFRLRFRLMTSESDKTPIVRTTVVETISRVPIKYSFSLPFRAVENDVDLQGDADSMTPDEKMELLDRWAESLTPLTLRATRRLYDNKTVFIDPSPATPAAEFLENYVAKLTLIQV